MRIDDPALVEGEEAEGELLELGGELAAPEGLECAIAERSLTFSWDAVRNAKAAIEEGLLPGGGVALVQAAAKAESDVKLEGDEATGAAIVFRAIEAPIKQIAEKPEPLVIR